MIEREKTDKYLRCVIPIISPIEFSYDYNGKVIAISKNQHIKVDNALFSYFQSLGYEVKNFDHNLNPGKLYPTVTREDYIEIDQSSIDWANISLYVKDLLLMKKRQEAIYHIQEVFLKHHSIYTVRHDKRPEMWIYADGIYIPHGRTYVENFVLKVLESAFTTTFANAVCDIISVKTYINHEDFFQFGVTNPYICLYNGLFNLETGHLEPYDPSYIFFSKFGVTYDKSKDCPKIREFIQQIVKYPDKDILLLQEIFGWLFYKNYRFEKIMMFLGDGRNGKSKLIELIELFVSKKSCSEIQPQVMENPESFNICNMFGKIANLAPDISSTSLKNTSVLKQLSGNDTITANRKFMDSISFKNSAKLIFGANELPKTYDTKDALWERFILVEFPYKFVTQEALNSKDAQPHWRLKIEDIVTKLCDVDEMSGLFNWAYKGYLRLQKNKAFTYYYTPSQVRSMWIRKSDSFMSFFMDKLEIDYESRTSKDAIRRAYALYCKEHKVNSVSEKHIARIMADESITSTRVQSLNDDGYMWEGIRFKDDANLFIEKKTADKIEIAVYKAIEQMPKNNATFLHNVFNGKIDAMLKSGMLIEIQKDTIQVR